MLSRAIEPRNPAPLPEAKEPPVARTVEITELLSEARENLLETGMESEGVLPVSRSYIIRVNGAEHKVTVPAAQ